MKRYRIRTILMSALSIIAFGFLAAKASGSTTPVVVGKATLSGALPVQVYVLPKAKDKCKTWYVKETLRIKERNKTVRVVGCVYSPPPPKPVAAAPKPADPPTVATVTSNDNPATVGDAVTYTVTVDHVLSATTGALQIWDGTVQMTNCNLPTLPIQPDTNGEISGTCTEMYNGAGTYHISGIFTGDDVYAQAAGAYTETVGNMVVSSPAPQPPTTTIPVSTTTTTLPPAPSISTSSTHAPLPNEGEQVVVDANIQNGSDDTLSFNVDGMTFVPAKNAVSCTVIFVFGPPFAGSGETLSVSSPDCASITSVTRGVQPPIVVYNDQAILSTNGLVVASSTIETVQLCSPATNVCSF